MDHLDALLKLAQEHPFLAGGVLFLVLIELIHRASLVVDLLISLVRGLKSALRLFAGKFRTLWEECTHWDIPSDRGATLLKPHDVSASRALEVSQGSGPSRVTAMPISIDGRSSEREPRVGVE